MPFFIKIGGSVINGISAKRKGKKGMYVPLLPFFSESFLSKSEQLQFLNFFG